MSRLDLFLERGKKKRRWESLKETNKGLDVNEKFQRESGYVSNQMSAETDDDGERHEGHGLKFNVR